MHVVSGTWTGRGLLKFVEKVHVILYPGERGAMKKLSIILFVVLLFLFFAVNKGIISNGVPVAILVAACFILCTASTMAISRKG
ncbi:hypothetical protein QV65_11130 [Rhodococcus erythropolis]|nr:hypothetical protein QV65_11130 [Rhodococcus erythropolis]